MTLKKLIERIILKLGRENYLIDNKINNKILIQIIKEQFWKLIRGLKIKLYLKKSNGIIFAGKNVKIKFGKNIEVGKSFNLGNEVIINGLAKKLIIIGNNVTIQDNVLIECTGVINNLGEGLILKDNIGIAHGTKILARGKIEIGNNVIIGPNVIIISENHNFSDKNVYINKQGVNRKGIIIKEGVWIGANVVILDGVTVGKNSIIGAGSIVTKDIEDYSIYAGNPAKKIKKR